MREKAIVLTCDKCGAIDILRKVADGPSDITNVEGYENRRLGWVSVMRYPDNITGRQHLCPVCAKKYQDLIDDFWKDNMEDQDISSCLYQKVH